MNILHEIVEMYPRPSRDIWWKCLEEKVHQHCLSAANISIHVETLWKAVWDVWAWLLCLARTEKGPKERLFRRLERVQRRMDNFWRLVVAEHFMKVLKMLDNSYMVLSSQSCLQVRDRIHLWWSSSRKRPECTRSSYSSIGPCVDPKYVSKHCDWNLLGQDHHTFFCSRHAPLRLRTHLSRVSLSAYCSCLGRGEQSRRPNA